MVVSAFISLVLCGIGILIYLNHRSRRHNLPLPPGPKPLPFIGNLLDLPSSAAGWNYHEMGKTLQSDVIYLEALGMRLLVLNSFQTAKELLEAKNLSSRPFRRMLSDSRLMAWSDWTFAFMPYGDEWRARRRIFHRHINESTTSNYRHFHVASTQTLIKHLLESPQDFLSHFYHFAGSTMMSLAYGIEIKDKKDRWIVMAHDTVEAGSYAGVKYFAVDFIPFLKYVPEWLPGAGFKRLANRTRKLSYTLIEEPFKICKNMVAMGTAPPSFVSRSLEDPPENVDRATFERRLAETASVMYSAGTDTSATLLSSIIYALLMHPEVLKKAQGQLDAVIPSGTLPTFEDEPTLPYILALILETIRWAPTAPLALPHLSTEEDTYRGWRIPAGTIVIGNVWAMLHNEEAYPDPMRFNPDRFIKNGKLNTDNGDPRDVAFGFGRRICPGRFLAMQSVFYATVNILALFDISPPKEADDSLPSIPQFNEASIVRHPIPFRCSITPRSDQLTELINTINAD